MINLEEWKEYSKQVGERNLREIKATGKLQKEMQEKNEKEYQERLIAWEKEKGEESECYSNWKPRYTPTGIVQPLLVKSSIEGFLDWLSEGKPEMK